MEIVAVKVLRSNGAGTLSDVIRGIEWVVRDHNRRAQEAAIRWDNSDSENEDEDDYDENDDDGEGKEKPKKSVRSVANMSLGGGKSVALDRAVDAAVEAGVHFAVAAGNDFQDSCNYSPAGSKLAVTVGATTDRDSLAMFSNWGKCVDILAPGQQITSSWIGSSVATNTISGTSMA